MGDRGEVKKLGVRVEDGIEVREAEVVWDRLGIKTWVDIVHIKNDLETAYAENNPIIMQVAMFDAHQSFVRQLRWRKAAKHKLKEKNINDAREEHTLVTCSPDGTIKIWTTPKQLRRAREWDLKHLPPAAEVNTMMDDNVSTPGSSPKAAKSPLARAAPTDLERPPAGAGVGDLPLLTWRGPILSDLPALPALPPLPKLENAPSSSVLRLAGSSND